MFPEGRQNRMESLEMRYRAKFCRQQVRSLQATGQQILVAVAEVDGVNQCDLYNAFDAKNDNSIVFRVWITSDAYRSAELAWEELADLEAPPLDTDHQETRNAQFRVRAPLL